MGRHRRSAAGRAATGVTQTDGSYAESRGPLDSHAGDRATLGIAPYLNPEIHSEAYAKSEAYLFATDDDDFGWATDAATFPGDGAVTTAFASDGFAPDSGMRRPGAHRRPKKKAATPVRTGLLGVSAAVALGTVAVATGAVPGLDNYRFGGGGDADKVQAAETPTNTPTEQGGTSGSAQDRTGGSAAGRNGERSTSPSPSPSTPSEKPEKTKTPEKTPETPAEKPAKPEEEKTTTPSRTAANEPTAPEKPSAPVTVSAQAAAEAEVLRLVNEERSKAGCSPVAANSALRELAEDFSEDMAARGFFDHTDPDGASPWDRAAKAGIKNLGGENIARGQADAAAVMEGWMNSPGHRANILNCDFKTLGVGVHFGSGGPWWTQDFGY
ncbi:CAP domain-containing protein [Streptomyces sp. TRM68367]|uniref:CAP domain-containing protein n=1 Tax=Streptomyces sp. TRM68367 TaxID=2758415 RepID=UPI00165AF878|nr:CAP domain-containing protein [Streptomyces sp. TRM68367]MBC9723554.1 CAP domain-containing protein [Streptomyces sp. TRM68367]